MQPELIRGSNHKDQRGELEFFNDLDLSPVVRFYKIIPSDTKTVRAWQGHKLEKKWFYCLRGSFIVNLLPLSNFDPASCPFQPEIYTLQANKPKVLTVPPGYVSGFRAKEMGSELMVFSDKSLEESIKDDYRFVLDEHPFVESN